MLDVYDLQQDDLGWMMVLPDFGGESLTQLGVAGKLDLLDFLRLAIKITQLLGQIHQQQICHKDINPSNIVLNPISQQVQIIDFGISTLFSREGRRRVARPNVLEGTLG